MEKINCSYIRCPCKNETIKDYFVCKTCRERIYCSENCMNKDWNEIHSEMCLLFSRGASVLKFRFEEFEDLYASQTKNYLKSYGGLGTNKLVKHKQSLKPFVLKTIPKKIAKDIIVGKYEEFFSGMRNLKYPHILRIFHYNQDKNNIYLILECAKTGSLRDMLNIHQYIKEEEAFSLFCQCCLGLEYLHSKNLIHGDFRIENILLSEQNNVKLVDCCYSQNILTKKNYSGNLEYVSPEQIIHDIQDNRSDIWGLGILLYELLHGYAPFKNDNYKILFENIYRNKQISFQPNLTPEVIDLIQKLLNKLPSNRISLEEIYQHPWMKKYEKLFEISIDEFREKIKNLTEKSNNTVERELLLEEGFSPELSPTRKLKKKRIVAEEKDENNSKIKTEDNDDSEMEENQGLFYEFLKKLTKFCKC